MLLFAGEAFETDCEHRRLRSLLIGEVQAACTQEIRNRQERLCLSSVHPVRLFQRSYRVWGASGRLGACSAFHFTRREDLHAQLQVGGGENAPTGPEG